MSDCEKDFRKDYSKFDSMSTEVLKEILCESITDSSDNSDIDTLMHISEVIVSREKHNFDSSIVDEAWERFQNEYLPTVSTESLYDDSDNDDNELNLREASPFKKKRKTSTLMRIALVAAILAALIGIGSLTASALGYDLFGGIARWTSEIFGFDTSKYSKNDLISELTSRDISLPLVPRYIPSGFSSDSIAILDSQSSTTFDATYLDQSGNNFLFVTITEMDINTASLFEKDDAEVLIYNVCDIDHYIMHNLNNVTAVWQNQNYECSISGPISVDEIKLMIDSIYEGK